MGTTRDSKFSTNQGNAIQRLLENNKSTKDVDDSIEINTEWTIGAI